MSPLNDEQPSGKPSLFGAQNTNTTGTPENHRVLAHLEGRKPPTSSPQKAIGGGLLLVLLIAGGGLYAWRSHTSGHEATYPTHNTASTPSAPPVTQATASIKPAPQPARILQDSAPSPQTIEPTTANAHAGSDQLHLASPASVASIASPAPITAAKLDAKGSTKQFPANRSKAGPAKTYSAKTRPSGDTNKAPTKRAITSAKVPPRQAEKLDPDAELLATLLQRRDPQTPGQHK